MFAHHQGERIPPRPSQHFPPILILIRPISPRGDVDIDLCPGLAPVIFLADVSQILRHSPASRIARE